MEEARPAIELVESSLQSFPRHLRPGCGDLKGSRRSFLNSIICREELEGEGENMAKWVRALSGKERWGAGMSMWIGFLKLIKMTCHPVWLALDL